MIAGMAPELMPGQYVFAPCPDDLLADALPFALASFREAEGLSLILPVDAAARLELPVGPIQRQITLQVYSALEGVGLTAAVSAALAEIGIPANVVAALRHDHVFVPEGQAEAAVAALVALQKRVAGERS